MQARRVHFVGIGGYSMSGLALYLKRQAVAVTGSDMKPSSRTDRLQAAGVEVRFGHDPSHIPIPSPDLVVYNTDVPPDNPEIREAAARGIPLWHRSQLLAAILDGKPTVAVSGTHGKTTTTSMVGFILVKAGLDPTVLVGGEVDAFGGNVHIGRGAWMVVEADESDGSFLRYQPTVAVATNIEPEHLEHYQGEFGRVVAAYRAFLDRIPSDGLAVVGWDSPPLAEMAAELSRPVLGYGLHPGARLRAEAISADAAGTTFTAVMDGQPLTRVRLAIPGRHNVVNALAAMAAAHRVGVDWAEAASLLEQFRNARRRFQVLWEGAVRVVDDYAHHPSEIRATLAAARQVTRGRVVAAFQPQRYTRTKHLWEAFPSAFGEADEVFLTDIYAPPGERPIAGVSGAKLAAAVAAAKPGRVHFIPDLMAMVPALAQAAGPGDTVCTMGAGDIWRVGEALAGWFRGQAAPPEASGPSSK